MRRLLIVLLCSACAQSALADSAVRPRELVHPFPATGPIEIAGTTAADKVLRTMQRYANVPFTDLLASHVAHTLRGASDPPVTVVRRPQQRGNHAAASVAAALPDGRTLLLGNAAPDRGGGSGLRAVALVAAMPFVLIATADSKYAGLDDWLRETRAVNERLFVASPGERSAAHVGLEALRSLHAVPLQALAYNGGHAALQAVATKQVNAGLVPLPAVLPYLRGGRLKALALTEQRRHPSIPQVQTSAEAGVPDFESVSWFGLFAPAATPQSAVREINVLLARRPSEQAHETFFDLGLRLEHRANP